MDTSIHYNTVSNVQRIQLLTDLNSHTMSGLDSHSTEANLNNHTDLTIMTAIKQVSRTETGTMALSFKTHAAVCIDTTVQLGGKIDVRSISQIWKPIH